MDSAERVEHPRRRLRVLREVARPEVRKDDGPIESRPAHAQRAAQCRDAAKGPQRIARRLISLHIRGAEEAVEWQISRNLPWVTYCT